MRRVFLQSLANVCVKGRAAAHLQNEHILSEVIAVFEDDADGVFGQSGGVGPFKLQPQRLLLRCHHFTLLDLNGNEQYLSSHAQIYFTFFHLQNCFYILVIISFLHPDS